MRVLFGLFFFFFSYFAIGHHTVPPIPTSKPTLKICKSLCEDSYQKEMKELKICHADGLDCTDYEQSINDNYASCFNACMPTCAVGTTLSSTASFGGGGHVFCRCPKRSPVSSINPGEPFSACSVIVNHGEDCGQDPRLTGGFITPKNIAKYDACIQRKRNSQAQSEAAAQAQAQADLANKIKAARQKSIRECNNQTQSFINQCETLTAQAPQNIDPTNTGSLNQCNSLKRLSKSVVSQVETQVKDCIDTHNNVLINFCPQKTEEQIGSASFGNKTIEVKGSGDISENEVQLSQAQRALSNLNTQSSQLNREMRDIKRQAEKCIAAFKQDPDNSKGGSSWLGLAETAAQAFGSLNEDTGGGATSDEFGRGGGGGSFSDAAVPTPGFQGSGGPGFIETPNNLNDDENVSFNGGGDPKNPEVPGPREQAPTGNPNNNPQGGGLGGGGGRGFGNGSNGSGSGSSAKKQKKAGRRRNFSNSKDRNLLLGYKKVTRNGSAFTFSSKDLKKYGRDYMIKAAKEARKNLRKKDTPLLFKNGRFVIDYLEMKESLAWKRHNQRMKNRMSGLFNSQKEQKAKEFHPCATFGECYSESRYNIFKLHHFKIIRHLKPND